MKILNRFESPPFIGIEVDEMPSWLCINKHVTSNKGLGPGWKVRAIYEYRLERLGNDERAMGCLFFDENDARSLPLDGSVLFQDELADQVEAQGPLASEKRPPVFQPLHNEPKEITSVKLTRAFTEAEKRIIWDTYAHGASEREFSRLMTIVEARGLNPFAGGCYFVKRYDRQRGADVWQVQVSIDALRAKAEETGLYAGQDEPEFEYDQEGALIRARVRVYRRDTERVFVGLAYYEEFVQRARDGIPSHFWKQMPHNQLAKCAESQALHKAFPKQLGQLYTSEEMAQASNEVEASKNSEFVKEAESLLLEAAQRGAAMSWVETVRDYMKSHPDKIKDVLSRISMRLEQLKLTPPEAKQDTKQENPS